MLAKKTSKNQVTLPRDIAKQFPQIEYFDVVVKDSKIILSPVKIRPVDATLADIRNKMERRGISEADVKDAVTWARKRKQK
jgi:hypothetical protein